MHEPMFSQCSFCYNPKTENFFMSLGSTEREHWSNMGQHGIIHNNYETINMIWNEKKADVLKATTVSWQSAHPTRIQSICHEN